MERVSVHGASLISMSLLLLAVGCGGGSSNASSSNASPTITSVSVSCSPSSIQVNQTSSCSATVAGTGTFNPAVNWTASSGSIDGNGTYTAPGTAITATVTATSVQDMSRSGTAQIKITQPNPVPFINQPLAPMTAVPRGSSFTLTVNGSGFVPGAIVNWNGSSLTTTFINDSQLTASVPASDIVTPGTASVAVVNAIPGGGTSNNIFFPVALPANLLFSGSAFAVGSSPQSAVTGDFNDDGKLDLAVANPASNNISVLLGNGDGTFQAPVNYAAGVNPWTGMAVGDFRGNGKLDLVAANFGSNNVSVLLGNSDGTFQSAVNYDGGVNPTWVAVGDFNRDGKLDLAVSDQNCTSGAQPCGPGTVSVLLGNGDGTFKAHVDYHTPPGGEGLNSVALGDFNNDGYLDLAVAAGDGAGGNQISVLLGNSDGTFRTGVNYTANANPDAIATADFNKDGNLDLIVVNNVGLVSILLGNGDGTFQTHVDYPGFFPMGGSIGIGDFNEDGNLDFAVTNGGTNDTVGIFLGNGDGTFQPQVQFGTSAYPNGVVVGDFNGDGRLDLAVPNYNDSTVSVLLQSGTVQSNAKGTR
jgi:FG-GAP-like repeat